MTTERSPEWESAEKDDKSQTDEENTKVRTAGGENEIPCSQGRGWGREDDSVGKGSATKPDDLSSIP